MRRRFFVEEIQDGRASLSGEDARHLTRVLRAEAGQRFELSDNRDAYLAEIESTTKADVTFRILELLPSEPQRVRVTLCAALFKFDHFEWMIEKATELGVTEILPVIAARTEHGLDKAAQKRVDRWRRIALESSQQCRRTHMPEIRDAVNLTTALTHEATHRFALDENPGGAPLAQSHGTLDDTIAILIGPEGGWTDAERAQFIAADWQPVSMGNLILRAETSAIAALAVISNGWLLH
jgi:16S rRNA (uracil1498-N3)-methyltransferase